jgi:hypothetical protein
MGGARSYLAGLGISGILLMLVLLLLAFGSTVVAFDEMPGVAASGDRSERIVLVDLLEPAAPAGGESAGASGGAAGLGVRGSAAEPDGQVERADRQALREAARRRRGRRREAARRREAGRSELPRQAAAPELRRRAAAPERGTPPRDAGGGGGGPGIGGAMPARPPAVGMPSLPRLPAAQRPGGSVLPNGSDGPLKQDALVPGPPVTAPGLPRL